MARASIPRYARTMYLEQVLVMFDGPQVVLMKSDRGMPAIGVALDDYGSDDHYMHFAEVTEKNLRRYLDEKVDLRYLFKGGASRRYWADWADMDEQGWIKVKRADDIQEEEYFPRHGFWSRHHTEELAAAAAAPQRLARFAIDGSWDASDFSRFYGKAADLYALLTVTSADALKSFSTDTLAAVRGTVRTLGWRGGGSYVSFYDSVFSKVFALSPLRVRRIAYSSPGTIDLKGAEGPLADVSRVVEQFGTDDGTIKTAYGVVDRILSHERLKTANLGAKFNSETSEELVLANCKIILARLGVDDPEALLSICDNDLVVFAKVTLSFYRRARDLYAFHAEGRVTSEGLADDY